MAIGSTVSLKEYGFSRCFMEVNSLCNMACSFCSHPSRQWKRQDLARDQVMQVIHELADGMDPTEVGFNVYNEPLLYKDLFACIDECRRYNLPVLLVSNGLLLTGKNIVHILDHEPTTLRISLQVVCEEKHNEARGCLTKYPVYIDNIARCVAVLLDTPNSINVRIDVAVAKRYTGVRSVLMRLGCYDPGEPSIRFQSEERLRTGLHEFLKKVEQYSGSFTYNERALTDSIRTSFQNSSSTSMIYALSERIEVYQKEFFHLDRKDFHAVKYGNCQSQDLCVLSNGVVTPCCLDYRGKLDMGNITSDSLKGILEKNAAFLHNLRHGDRIERQLCRQCLGSPTYQGAKIKDVYHWMLNRRRVV